jgi:hypothetical protein
VVDPLDIEDIVVRIKQLVSDLEMVRDGTSGQLFSPEQRARHKDFFEAPGSMAIIAQFKEVLDDLRQMMWLHIEVAAARTVREPETRNKLLQRAAEILCALSVEHSRPKQQFKAVARSYVDRVMELVESRMGAKEPGER